MFAKVPRSYTPYEIVDRFVELLSTSPGSMPSARRLAKALALSPSALYRYFPSMASLEDAACIEAIRRLLDEAEVTTDPGGPLAGAVRRRPGLVWAITRLDSDRPPIDDPTAVRMTGIVDAPPLVRTAALATVGVLWRTNRQTEAWRSEVDRVLPPVVRLFERAARAIEGGAEEPTEPTLRVDPAIVDDPIVSAVLGHVWEDGAAPSLRDVARRLATPRSTAFRRLTAEQVADQVRETIYLQSSLRSQFAVTADLPPDPATRILWNWLPAVDVFFERPALVDVFVRGSVAGNTHRERQRAVWAENGVTPPHELSHDDLTDVLAGFVMYCARRRAAGPGEVRSVIRGMVAALLDPTE